jgi:hypothetical protein
MRTRVAAIALVLASSAARADFASVDESVDKALAEQGGAVRAALWVGGTSGARYTRDAGATLPTASAVKTAILIELFAKFAGSLDRAPEGLDAVLKDEHPAVAHFTAAQREEIRKGLTDASARRIGGVMMGSIEASNLVYNAAANVAIALLGGPEGATRAIRARDPAFAPIAVRRYMLADRKAHGDNEATAEALAAVLRRLAARQVKGLEAETVEAIRKAILTKDDPKRGHHFLKDGDLASAPITVVRSGWYEPAAGGPAVVYVVMLARPDAGATSADEAHRKLSEAGARLRDVLVDAAGDAPRSAGGT